MPKIAIVGEAWGADEERARTPFVDASGRVLNFFLKSAGIDRDKCFVTNVFNLRPAKNDVKSLCDKKAFGIPGMPQLAVGKYVRAEYAPEIERLYAEMKAADPDLIIALGGTAAWALTASQVSISKIRGTPISSIHGTKIIPTYHPAAVIRDWSLNPIVHADFEKALRQSAFREIRRPPRELWIEPTFGDLLDFERRFIYDGKWLTPDLSVDIETRAEQITCIGFAPTRDRAIVVPFWKLSGGSYWPTRVDEVAVWRLMRKWLTHPNAAGQNFIYDMTYLWRRYGIPVPGAGDDTMLLHHALQPELPKALGFLGSLYTDEPSWKFMRHKSETLKRED